MDREREMGEGRGEKRIDGRIFLYELRWFINALISKTVISCSSQEAHDVRRFEEGHFRMHRECVGNT
jgi:hypothetical protein